MTEKLRLVMIGSVAAKLMTDSEIKAHKEQSLLPVTIMKTLPATPVFARYRSANQTGSHS